MPLPVEIQIVNNVCLFVQHLSVTELFHKLINTNAFLFPRGKASLVEEVGELRGGAGGLVAVVERVQASLQMQARGTRMLWHGVFPWVFNVCKN